MMYPPVDLDASDMITQLGVMSKVSTGHAWGDIAMCVLLPPIIKALLPTVIDWASSCWRSFRGHVYSRSVEFIRENDYRSPWSRETDENPPNILLQNAIMAYINSFPGLHQNHQRTSVQILLGEEPLEKQLLQNPKKDDARHSRFSDEVKPPDFSDVYRYRVNFLPQVNHWIWLDAHIRFTRREKVMDKDAKKVKIIFVFEAYGPGGGKKIDDFLDKALEYYKQLRVKKEDNSRFLYIPSSFPGHASTAKPSDKEATGGQQRVVTYKRYKLTDRKTFANLYHPDKRDVVRLVDDFMAKRGKFAIAGYPDKLGFLLHGPPGTGKTSFIKALAQYTGRSVVSIPLARISTNQELMDLMFDQRVAVEGDDMPLSLPFSQSIFVIEDVDAASKVVRARNGRKPSSHTVTGKVDDASNLKGGGSSDGDDDDHNTQARVSEVTTELVEDADGSKKLVAVRAPPPVEDALNLAGLLNVLDGVVDTPDRILVMTTNHPERLDPALTRPGRVTRQIYMGHMRVAELVEMMQDFYEGVDDGEVWKRLEGVFEEGRWSPAEIEAKCALYDTVDELVADLERCKGVSST